MSAFGISYPEAPNEGIWGEKTSLENYCEEDYVITTLFAEFINTLTNLAYVVYAWYGIHKCWRHPDFWWLSFPYFGIAGVGVCSAAFHGTIKLYAQWSDDLSMFFATGIMLHRVMSFGKSRAWSRNFAIGVTAFLVLVAIYHCYMIETIVHQCTFIVMVHMVAFKTRGLVKDRVKSDDLRQRMKFLSYFGTGSFRLAVLFTAWGLWSLDNIFCSDLKEVRRFIGIPWGFLLELHGWWHILTAIAVYSYFVLIEHLTAPVSVEESVKTGSPFAWPVSSRLLSEMSQSKKNR